jgi:hypothetical protein
MQTHRRASDIQGGIVMPRRRTDSNLLLSKGAFDKNPARGRARAGEPNERRPLPLAPVFLTEASEQLGRCWSRLPPGVLRSRDVPFLILAARLFSEFLRTPGNRVKAATVSRPEFLICRLGLSPSDASRISGGPSEAFSEFDEFALFAALAAAEPWWPCRAPVGAAYTKT